MHRPRPYHRLLAPFVALALLAVTANTPASSTNAAPAKLVVGYAAGWNISSRAAGAALDGSRLSLIIYAFIGINPAANACTPEWTDPETGTSISAAQMAGRFQGLKDNKLENPYLKVLLSIGGGGYQQKFEQLTDYSAFANSCANLMAQYGADGLDVDYEFPQTDANRQRLTSIMSALHTRIGNTGSGTGYLLTMGAAAGPWYGQWLAVETIKDYVDYFTTMAYNYHGSWESTLHFNSPASGCASGSALCAIDTAAYYVGRGVPKSKLLIGIGWYGNQYSTSAGCGAAPGGSGYASVTTIDYKTMRGNGMLSGPATPGSGWTRGYHGTYQNAWLCNGNTWIGYEDASSTEWRANWLEDNGYPGIMIWELFKDHNGELLGAVCAAFGCSVGGGAGVSLPINSYQSLQVTTPGHTGRYLRHANGLGFTEIVVGSSGSVLKLDATYKIVAGLASGSCYSFESRNFPSHYLRHSGYRIRKDARDGSGIFDQDATFCARPGLSGSGVSLESYNFPNRYIRHINSEVWIASNGGPNWWDSQGSFAADVTWNIAPAWAP